MRFGSLFFLILLSSDFLLGSYSFQFSFVVILCSNSPLLLCLSSLTTFFTGGLSKKKKNYKITKHIPWVNNKDRATYHESTRFQGFWCKTCQQRPGAQCLVRQTERHRSLSAKLGKQRISFLGCFVLITLVRHLQL